MHSHFDMRQIIFITSERWPNLSPSDQLVAQALVALGHTVTPRPWQMGLDALAQAGRIVLRSNWDYHYHMAAFTAWLDLAERHALPLDNSVALVRWNLHKGYLLDLHGRGIQIPTSRILQPEQQPASLYAEQGWSSAVIKPIYGASGHQVEHVAQADLDEWAVSVRQQQPAAQWLLQAFMPEIQQTGELSLIFLNGAFSHAVAKQPQQGEFRINSQYQGQITRVDPPSPVRQQANAVLACLPTVPLYARVDGIVNQAGEFCLIELELNEPALYFQYAPAQAIEFARVIAAKLV